MYLVSFGLARLFDRFESLNVRGELLVMLIWGRIDRLTQEARPIPDELFRQGDVGEKSG